MQIAETVFAKYSFFSADAEQYIQEAWQIVIEENTRQAGLFVARECKALLVWDDRENYSAYDSLAALNFLLSKAFPFIKVNAKVQKLIVVNAEYTLAPENYFEQKESEVLVMHVNILPGETVHSTKCKYQPVKVIYAQAKEFDSFSTQHFISSLIDHTIAKSNNADDLHVSIHKREKYCDMVFVKDQKLLLANSFHSESNDDVLYYLLFCLEQLKCDEQKSNLYLSGDLKVHDSLLTLLEKYLSHVSLANTGIVYQSLEKAGVQDPHRYPLFSI